MKMMEDYTHKLQLSNINDVSSHVTEDWLLIGLEERLQSLGKELRDVDLRSPDVTTIPGLKGSPQILESDYYNSVTCLLSRAPSEKR
jgi:hypothetical protein